MHYDNTRTGFGDVVASTSGGIAVSSVLIVFGVLPTFFFTGAMENWVYVGIRRVENKIREVLEILAAAALTLHAGGRKIQASQFHRCCVLVSLFLVYVLGGAGACVCSLRRSPSSYDGCVSSRHFSIF